MTMRQLQLQQLSVDYTHYEVAFPAQGDLGIGIKVDKDGVVVVSDIKQVKGYAELRCPELASGDILVAVDHEPVGDKPFDHVMALLRDSKQSRPTHLEFLNVDYYDARADAVKKWTKHRTASAFGSNCEGEFDVDFAPQQPTGLRFTESYVMTNPLKLAHIDDVIYRVLPLKEHAAIRKLLHMVLVRIGSQSVLGAPISEVTALMYSEDGPGADAGADGNTGFPKALWLASADNLEEDYAVLTVAHPEQLKWLCFVPIEMTMEVPAVSFAAKAAVATSVDQAVVVKASDGTFQRERRDGIRIEQYLMAINGVSTLRISAFPCAVSPFGAGKEPKPLLDVVTKALDAVLGRKRTLRFRDLTQYRREFQTHQPLSPWSRRRRPESLVMVENEANSLISLLDNLSLRDGSKAKATMTATRIEQASGGDDEDQSAKSEEGSCTIRITRRPRDLSRLLLQEIGDLQKEQQQQRAQCATSDAEISPQSQNEPSTTAAVKRPYIKTYRGLENCEGVRRNSNISEPLSAAPTAETENVRKIVIPDNLRPVGIQLETELMTTLTIFKSFTRMNGPALASKQVARGDILVSIDGTPVEDIPTDTLIRLLQGRQQQSLDTESKVKTGGVAPVPDQQPPQGARMFKFARKKTRGAVASLLAGLWTKGPAGSPEAQLETRTASTTS